MVKLYYSPQSCSASCFIAAYANFVNLEVEQVDLGTHKTASGKDFLAVNPKGNVPTLVFDDGSLLTETAAALQWIADVSPGKIAPKPSSEARYFMLNALNFVASELHPALGALFRGELSEKEELRATRDFLRARAAEKLSYVDRELVGSKKWVANERKSVADYYLFVCLSWTAYLGIDLAVFPSAHAYYVRLGKLPEVKESLKRMAENPATVFDREFYQVQCAIA